MAKLEARHLTISFRTNNGAVRAVRDVSFELNAGETLAIAGESGSGKSVTARAIMGILAGNAMVENGELIYDGRDLLKIPEEEFHTLRGYKLAMVFQDPLSALNPIMRIGAQLTEAMILNNKERRRDGKKRFAEYMKQLEKSFAAAGVPDAGKKLERFKSIIEKGVSLDESYETAMESAVEALDCCEEMRAYAAKRERKSVKEAAKRLKKACERVYGPYVILQNDTAFQSALASVITEAENYSGADAALLTMALDQLEPALKKAGEPEVKPDFFAIGYAGEDAVAANSGAESIDAVNERCRSRLDKEFLDGFRKDTETAFVYTGKASIAKKKKSLEVLRTNRAVFEKPALDRRESEKAAREAADAVDAAINRLSVEKESASYVFRSSIKANIERYFYGVKANPKEEKRFAKDTVKHDKLQAAGKIALSVVPRNLVDLDQAKQNILNSFDELISQYDAASDVQAEKEAPAKAASLIASLRDWSSQASHKVSKALAKHHAIELMQEVGIPEPYKRFHQYPFEFSGGMRQRIVIAIALSANPDILICDEPTTALDVTIQAQILELINRLKVQRQLSVIFITHDLGVVANMADRLAVMYAGKIVEYGTADDVFYDPRHPYTWALLSSMPDLETKEKLEAIPGTPPDMIIPPVGDAFAARNKYAMQIDFERQPPQFKVSDTHWAATWLLHPQAPKVDPPKIVTERIERMRKLQEKQAGASLAARQKDEKGGAEE